MVSSPEKIFHWGERELPMGDHGRIVTPQDAVLDLLSWTQLEWGGASEEFLEGVLMMVYWEDGEAVSYPNESYSDKINQMVIGFETWRFVHGSNQPVTDKNISDPVAYDRLICLSQFLDETFPRIDKQRRSDILTGAYFAAYYFHGIPGRLPDREAFQNLVELVK